MTGLRSFVEKLAKRRKGFLRLGAILVLNVVVFFAVTQRLANKQDRLARDHERLAAELEERSGELAELQSRVARAAANATAVDEFWTETVRVRVPGLTEAWEEIDRLASESDVLKGRTSYDRDLLDVGLEQIKATMPVEGDYFDLVRFINRLERSPRFFLVEEVRLSQGNADDADIRLDCAISFYLRGAAAQEEAGP